MHSISSCTSSVQIAAIAAASSSSKVSKLKETAKKVAIFVATAVIPWLVPTPIKIGAFLAYGTYKFIFEGDHTDSAPKPKNQQEKEREATLYYGIAAYNFSCIVVPPLIGKVTVLGMIFRCLNRGFSTIGAFALARFLAQKPTDKSNWKLSTPVPLKIGSLFSITY